jgi:hypothetical protein
MDLYYNPERKTCIAVLDYSGNLAHLTKSFQKIKEMEGVKLKRFESATIHYISESYRYKSMFVMEFQQSTRPSDAWFETTNEKQCGL